VIAQAGAAQAVVARAISLLLASVASAGLLFLPAMRGGALSSAEHGLLAATLIVVCGLFVSGVGYVPEHRWLRPLLSPVLLWPALSAAAVAWTAGWAGF
jgi:predicted membrane protein